jgi:ATP-binding cassette subfamily B protein/subfamily B ATP-binding cassette protein MsbA
VSRWWVRLARYARPQAAGLLAVLILGLAGVAADALKPWPMKLVVDTVLAGGALPGAAAWLGGLPGAGSPVGLLGWLTAGTVLLFLARWGARAWEAYLKVGIGARLLYGLGGELFDHLQRMSLRFHGRRPTGDLVKRVTTDTGCLRELVIDVVLPLFSALGSLIFMFTIMWRMDRELALVAVAVAPLLSFAMWRFAGPMQSRNYEQMEAQGDLMAHAERTLVALPVVRAFARERHESSRFEERFRRNDRAYVRLLTTKLGFKFGTGAVTALGTTVVLALGGLHVMQGKLTVGGLLVFTAYLASLYAPIETLAYLTASYASAAAGARRVFEVLDQEDCIHDAPDARHVPRRRGGVHLRMEGVVTGYEPGRPVLHGIDLEAQPGEMVAIVGPTGAGKTTLVSLIPRFLDPWEGRVLWNGEDLRKLKLKDVRAQVAMVLQESLLLPLTVAENIAYGSGDARREAIVEAALAANADAFIRKLPDGYETVLGERGATLSGGERQRLAIARAFLRDAPVLILDEPTSALDAETESLIVEALERLRKGRTTFIIAHRLSTTRRADRIVAVKSGEVLEGGTQQELLSGGAHFTSLVSTPLGRLQTDIESQIRGG